jgi:hypothetical protein
MIAWFPLKEVLILKLNHRAHCIIYREPCGN